MAAKLSHEPGPLGFQESQHELKKPQELSGSKNNDPNESISWYIVEDGQYSVCLMGFNPIDAYFTTSRTMRQRKAPAFG